MVKVIFAWYLDHNVTQCDKFVYQLGLIKQAFTTSSILLGDFNLDWQRRHDISYSHKNSFMVLLNWTELNWCGRLKHRWLNIWNRFTHKIFEMNWFSKIIIVIELRMCYSELPKVSMYAMTSKILWSIILHIPTNKK